ncbi:MAG: S1/P1 nuclease [Legionella sp.]|nr:S1/P1 nuclease [Legionella sp.]
MKNGIFNTFRCFLLALFSFFSFESWAWWSVGHRVVANIAYQHLTTSAKNKVDTLVKEFKKVTPEINSFEKMAVWPDTLYGKEKIGLTFNWHFVDSPYIVDGTRSQIIFRQDNIIWSLETIIDALKNNQASAYELSRLLAFLVHFLGDIHQPLHNISLVSAMHPKGDEGGNAYAVIFNQETVNLHRVWDNCFNEFNVDESRENIDRISQQITTTYPIEYFRKEINQMQPTAWSKEGYRNAIHFAYTTAEGEPLDSAYVNQGRQLIKREIALAGYRLALLLNRLY